MLVSTLECRGFRNLGDDRVGLGHGMTVVHGANGAGKTNLLEAIHFGLTSGSFRTGNDRDLIRHDEDSARVELELELGPGVRSRLLAAIDRRGERRHQLEGGRPVSAPRQRPLVSVFHPDRLQLAKGAPAQRRAHLDRLCAALWPARAELRRRFGRTLAQRNALVARVRAGEAGAEALTAWDERLAAEAEPLIQAREEATRALHDPFAELGAELGLEAPEVSYRPRACGSRRQLTAELAARRCRDLGRAYTSFGPQLDELELRLATRPLRRFGSQGQQRLAVLALLLAGRLALLEANRPAPLMLLDDVMSELDPSHRHLLVGLLGRAGQALITATEAEQVPGASAALRIGVGEGATVSLAASGEARVLRAGESERREAA